MWILTDLRGREGTGLAPGVAKPSLTDRASGRAFARIGGRELAVALLLTVAPGLVDRGGSARAEEEAAEAPPVRSAATSASRGAFLPWTMGARSDAHRGLVFVQWGYDGAARCGLYQLVAEAQLFGRLSLRAGGNYLGEGDTLRPDVGLRVDLLRQELQGLDLALVRVYEAKGFNSVRAATARVALSRAFGETRLIGNLGYGFGLQDDERYGDFRHAVLRRVANRLTLGVDARLRIDLERDASEPAGEPAWEVVGGPLVAYTLDRYVVSATLGYSAMKYRLVDRRARRRGRRARAPRGLLSPHGRRNRSRNSSGSSAGDRGRSQPRSFSGV